MQGMKNDYLPWSLFVSLHPHVIAVGCKIAKRGGVLNKTFYIKKLVHLLQESTGAVHPLSNFANDFRSCKSDRNAHNLLEVLHLSKFMANSSWQSNRLLLLKFIDN
jgi:hypothetical protein